MTLTLTPLTGSLASTYSVRPTPNLALSSRCDFNFYSWESQYVVGAEIFRPRSRRRQAQTSDAEDSLAWARQKLVGWFTPAEQALKDERAEREEENVLKIRVDDGWNIRALWTGRVKALLVSAGVSVSPVKRDDMRRWSGSVGVNVAYST